jgi:hypothetical protein
MNVANLQLQGLLMAVASINRTLVEKGLLSIDEVDLALRKAETSFTSEGGLFEELPPSNKEAICFPIRLLRTANHGQSRTKVLPFSELTKTVGGTRHPYEERL